MGDPQTMMWYPLSLLFSYFGWWNAFVLSAYVLASSFAYGYLYTLTNSRLAAALGGTLYGVSGFFLIRLVHTNIIHTAAWLPLLIWSLEMLRRQVARAWIVTTAVAIGFGALAGFPQIWIYSVSIAGLYALTMSVGCPAGAWRFLRSSLIGLVLGVGLAAILFIPMIELTGESVRSQITRQYAATFSLSFAQLPLLLFPLLSTDPFHRPVSFLLLEVTGYMALLSIILAFIGVTQTHRERNTRFWIAVGVMAPLLALGQSTPIGRMALLIPIYKMFRAPGRHMFEFAFAVTVLAAVGISSLKKMAVAKRLRSVRNASIGLGAVLSIASLFLLRSEKASVLILPFAILLLSALVLWRWAQEPSGVGAALLILVAVLDLGHFGYFLVWKDFQSRERDVSKPEFLTEYENVLKQSQQRLSPLRATEQPFGAASPNLSRLWGIPSVSGYNPLMLRRYRDLSNVMPNGQILSESLNRRDRSLDILSLRYLLVPTSLMTGEWQFERMGLGWRQDDLGINLGPGCNPKNPDSASFAIPDFEATEIGVVSSLSCSVPVMDKSNVLKLEVAGSDSTIQSLFLKAGEHTSEWAIDRADVRPVISHHRAQVFESFSGIDDKSHAFDGHHFVGILPISPTRIRELRLQWVGSEGSISLQRISLAGKISTYAITREADYLNDSTRWQRKRTLGDTVVYENLRAMPRVWLASKVIVLEAPDILRTVHESTLPDGTPYDPNEIALIENGPALNSKSDPERTASVVSMSEKGIEVVTHSREPAFLVLSDTYYPGWEATVDGNLTTIYRTDYVLRGVVLASGEHVVRLSFRPRTFKIGQAISAIALVFILGMLVTKARSSAAGAVVR
jgi:hypothetical protein